MPSRLLVISDKVGLTDIPNLGELLSEREIAVALQPAKPLQFLGRC